MFESLKTFFINIFATQETAYFSAFIQAMVTVGASIYGLFSFNKWMKQKFMEKRSDYADVALNFLENAHELIIDLLTRSQIADWDQKFQTVLTNFAQARRKAHRLGERDLDDYFQKYETILKSIETNHLKVDQPLFSSTEKANADNALSQAISELGTLYKKIYDELDHISLIKV